MDEISNAPNASTVTSRNNMWKNTERQKDCENFRCEKFRNCYCMIF